MVNLVMVRGDDMFPAMSVTLIQQLACSWIARGLSGIRLSPALAKSPYAGAGAAVGDLP